MPSKENYKDLSNDCFWDGLNKNSITFINIKPEYLITDSISIRIRLPPKIKAKETDMVGLFPLGWSSLRQSVTFEWVMDGKPNKCGLQDLTLQFTPQFYSQSVVENKHYQFVYVCRQIEVLGVSSPFRFCFNASRPDIKSLEEFLFSNKPLSARSCVPVDFICPPSSDGQSSVRLTLERNQYLEEKVAQLEKQLEKSISAQKKSEELVKYMSKRKKMSQAFIQSLMTDLDRKDTVKVVHGRTEMTIKRISKRERPKPESPCTQIIHVSNTPQLSSSRLEAIPSVMKELCLNVKESLKHIGLPLRMSGSKWSKSKETSDINASVLEGCKPVVKYFAKEVKKTASPVSKKQIKSTIPEKKLKTEEDDNENCMNQACENTGIIHEKLMNQEYEENCQYLVRNASSLLPSATFLEQRVFDMRQVLDVIVSHLHQTKSKWNLLWQETKPSGDSDGKSVDKKVKIKLVIPMTQKNINDMIGMHQMQSIDTNNGELCMQDVEAEERDKEDRDEKIKRKLEGEGIKMTGRKLEID